MKYILIVNVLILSACGKPAYVEPEIQKYVNRWNSIYKQKADDIEIRFVNVIKPSRVVGTCDVSNNLIVILKSYFEGIQELGKEQLIFHELGHCVLFLEHDTNYVIIKDSYGVNHDVYRSIMFPQAFGDNPMYRQFLDYYHNELGQ